MEKCDCKYEINELKEQIADLENTINGIVKRLDNAYADVSINI